MNLFGDEGALETQHFIVEIGPALDQRGGRGLEFGFECRQLWTNSALQQEHAKVAGNR